MDLGIRGRSAIVCASSQGLGKGCANALAEAGVALVINGRHEALLEQTAQEIRQSWGVSVTPVLADVSTAAGQAALLKACPNPDILINNNGGPPVRNFRELDREAMLTGVTMNMVTPIELIQRVIDSMISRGFGRIVNITSLSVKMPITGLDLSSGARAGLTAFMAGVSRSVADKNVTINNLLPGSFDTARLRGKRPILVEVPFLTPRLSSLWLYLVTPASVSMLSAISATALSCGICATRLMSAMEMNTAPINA